MINFRRLCHFGPLLALFIMFVCYAVSVIDTMLWLLPTGGRRSFAGKVNILVLTVWESLILGNFFRALFLGPGYVPKNWHPNDKHDEKYLQFCQICQGFKPPRAHHCRICERCVLKMDHHCPWINNCCGHMNHTNFVLFIFFAPIGCLHAFIVIACTVWSQLFWRDHYLRNTPRPILFTMNAFFVNVLASGLAVGTIIAVGILFYHQLKILLYNATGIEQWIIEKAEVRKSRGCNNFTYPYDYGKLKNITQVINWRCRPVGNGYTWEVVKGCNQYTLTIEQLQQKREKRDRLVRYDAVLRYSGYWIPCTQGICTCLHLPCTDEPRVALRPGDKMMVSRGTKYWLYGDKILDEAKVKEGMRERGWFPRRCAIKYIENENINDQVNSEGQSFKLSKVKDE